MSEGVMASVATGVMTSVIEKLAAMLAKEYAKSKGVHRKISFLKNELSGINAMMLRYAPLEESNPQIKAWMKEARELSYDMEDCIDDFVHRVELEHKETPQAVGVFGFFSNCISKLKKLGSRSEIANHIQELESLIAEASDRRARYSLSDGDAALVPTPAAIDPRLPALFVEESRLVGVDGPRDEIVRFLLTEGPADCSPRRRVVAMVGFGGCGKTTLANQVYKRIKIHFDWAEFISLSQNPDINKILKDMHSTAGYGCQEHLPNQQKLIDCIRRHLEHKRYLIIVDDIWNTSAWNTIQCAFPDHNNRANRVIATTRSAIVANFCCSSHGDLVYEVKPLSRDDSKALFMRRIFGPNDRWPPHLENISDQILKKCGGLPLAIVSIASMLANNPITHEQWATTLKSIGRSLENDPALDDVKKILLLSYSDLPQHLKTCLLFLSTFPEDYEISRDRLVWRWIAEGFIDGGHSDSRKETGEGYFNDLINRSMILPLRIGYDGRAESCRVHDVVLDLLISLSFQDNLVTVLASQSSLPMSGKIRRLSLQGHHVKLQPNVSLAHVRSLTCFNVSCNLPSTARFRNLRALDLEGCWGIRIDSHLESIGAMFLLRYLGLRYTRVKRLPELIGNLQLLETLDLRFTLVSQLPSSIVNLIRLVRLFFNDYVQLPDGVWDMTALNELSAIDICRYRPSFIRQLGKMSQLRDIKIFWNPQHIECGEEVAYKEAFASLLCELGNHNLRSLAITSRYSISLDYLLDSWCPDQCLLRKFEAPYPVVFSRFPKCMASLANLSKLVICIREVEKEDLDLLGDLPSLLFLDLTNEITPKERFIIGRDKFQCLKVLRLAWWCGIGLFFEAGALPIVEELRLLFSPDNTLSLNGGFDFGIQNLSSLRYVKLRVRQFAADPALVTKFEDAIRGAAQPLATVNVHSIKPWRTLSSVLGFVFHIKRMRAREHLGAQNYVPTGL